MSPAGAKRSEKIEADITCQAAREKHEAVVPVHARIIKTTSRGARPAVLSSAIFI
jgi:hypothetical protein